MINFDDNESFSTSASRAFVSFTECRRPPRVAGIRKYSKVKRGYRARVERKGSKT